MTDRRGLDPDARLASRAIAARPRGPLAIAVAVLVAATGIALAFRGGQAADSATPSDTVVAGDPDQDYGAAFVQLQSVGRAALAALQSGDLDAAAGRELPGALALALAWSARGDRYLDTAHEGQVAPRVLAVWLGLLRYEFLRAEGAAPEQVLAELEPIELGLDLPNAVALLVVRAECLRELGRLAEAERLVRAHVPDATAAAKLAPQDRVLLASCRADLDLRLGNYDEAVRHLAPWVDALGDLDPRLALRFGRTHADYLMATERFAEVGEWTRSVEAAGGAALDAHAAEVLRLQRAVAAVSAADAVPSAEVEAAAGELAELAARGSQTSTRTWAGLFAARAAAADADFERAAALLAAIEEPADERSLLAPCLAAMRAEVWLARQRDGGAPDPDELRHHRERLDDAWRSLDGEWRTAPARAGGVGFLHFAFRRDVLAHRLALAILEEPGEGGRERAFALLVDALSPHERAGLAEVRQRLLVDDRHGLLVYWPAGSATHVFAVDRQRLEHREIAGTRVLHRAVRALGEAIDAALLLPAGPAREAEAAERALALMSGRAAALRDLLLPAEVREHLLSWKAVSVVGSEMLLRAPFECLPVAGRLLGQVIAIDHLPSLPFALQRPIVPPHDERLRLALLGAVAATATDPALDAAYVAELRKAFDDERVQQLLEAACTRGAYRTLAPTDVLLCLLHGESRAAALRSWVLRLYDGDLTCEAIEKQGVAGARFVVLGACFGGRGLHRFGADVRADLGGACLAAGAQAVAVSPFALRLGPTRRLLATALPLLQDGCSPAEAWRAGRDALRGKVDALDEWTTAAMSVVGLGQRSLR